MEQNKSYTKRIEEMKKAYMVIIVSLRTKPPIRVLCSNLKVSVEYSNQFYKLKGKKKISYPKVYRDLKKSKLDLFQQIMPATILRIQKFDIHTNLKHLKTK